MSAASSHSPTEDPQSKAHLAPADVLVVATSFALGAGLLEGALIVAHGRLIQGFIYLSPHVVWMAPVANLIWFSLPALVLWALVRSGRAASPRVTIGVLSFLAWLTLLLLPSQLHRAAAILLAAGLAVQTARFLSRRAIGFLRLARRACWVTVGVVGILLAWSLSAPAVAEWRAVRRLPAADDQAPNVLLIVWDTVRRGSTSLYGYPRPTTPALEKWSRRGVRFDGAVSTTSWTLPSHASMFTGHWPSDLSAGWLRPLDATYPTLASWLTARGYRTGGFVANALYCNAGFGLARGFQRYEDFPVNRGELIINSSIGRVLSASEAVRRAFGYYDILGRKSGREVVDEFLAWLPEGRSRPFFAFLNFFDAHQPYFPPPELDREFASPTPRNLALLDNRPHMGNLKKAVERLSPAEVSRERDAYDAGIAYLDQHLDRLLTELERRGALARTIVIITSDHGEQFLEHGLFEHGNSLYGQVIDVPLVVIAPGAPQGRVVAQPVSLRDIPATVAGLLGLNGPFPGSSLSRYWVDPAQAPDPVVAQLTLPGGEKKIEAVILDGMKAIWGPDSAQVFDLRQDPGELHDLAHGTEGVRYLAQLRSVLDSMTQPAGHGPDRPVSGSSP